MSTRLQTASKVGCQKAQRAAEGNPGAGTGASWLTEALRCLLCVSLCPVGNGGNQLTVPREADFCQILEKNFIWTQFLIMYLMIHYEKTYQSDWKVNLPHLDGGKDRHLINTLA